MKKATVTLESLDKKIDSVEFTVESLNKKIDSVEFTVESLDKRIDRLDLNFHDFADFIRENMMLRNETQEYIDDRIETKFSKYTSDQLEFQDNIGKRCENVEHETLALHHRVVLVEKHIGI